MKVKGKTPIPKDKIRHILIRGTNWVGDAVMSLPAIHAIRQNFPHSRLTLLVKPWVKGLYTYCPDLDEIITYHQNGSFWSSRYHVIRELRKRSFDMAILFQNAFDAALITFLSGIPYRIGYNTDGRSWLLTHKVILSKEILSVHQVYYYLALVESMGWESEKPPYPYLTISGEEKNKVDNYLKEKGINSKNLILGFNPGAFFGSAKRWFPECYAVVADKAADKYGAKNIIFGSAKDLPVAEAMVSKMRSNPLPAVGQTSLEELAALISKCSLFITNDSGPMHMAAALRTPVIAIFGPTDPTTTSPFGENSTIVYHPLPCAPCLRRECHKDHLCMKSVTVEEVWQKVEEKIKQILEGC